ncbi:MAG: hypothetical protein WKF84_14360 [Pyrinomonadaceae bacterium]
MTINVGLRYEYQQLPEAQIANPLFTQTSEFPSDKNNFGRAFRFRLRRHRRRQDFCPRRLRHLLRAHH